MAAALAVGNERRVGGLYFGAPRRHLREKRQDTGKCGVCIPRCPIQAIGPARRDNHLCVQYSRGVVGTAFARWGYFSCGHCLTWLPCTDRIPFRNAQKHRRAQATP
jgi:epoxyqueuosine reductase QueG